MKRIKYFSCHGCYDLNKKRVNSPAADTKIDYIIESLNKIGYGVDHISRAVSSEYHSLPSNVEIDGDNTFRYFYSLGMSHSLFHRILGRLIIEMEFFIWCIVNLKRHEQIIVYHSLVYDFAFILLKRIKNLIIIGEIEEIYQDVHNQNRFVSRNEYRFISCCDKFLFPNTVLNEMFNKDNKPSLILHGIYRFNETTPPPNNDGKKHVLYSGTLDPEKGGAVASVLMAEYLPSNYHLHITGFGSNNEEKMFLDTLDKVMSVATCEITYHGFISEPDFLMLMRQCTIGLCTQDPTKMLNQTSFPSKILTYMSNGLMVLTGKSKAVENSYIGDLLYYYDVQEPQSMAKMVLRMDQENPQRGFERLEVLDDKFKTEMSELIIT